MRRRFLTLLLAMFACGSLVAGAGWCQTKSPAKVASTASNAVADEAAVAQYLQKLGLTGLQMRHLERAIDLESPPEQRLDLARQLADLYADRLLNLVSGEAEAADLHHRVDALIRRVPQADTPALRVMLLQADYNTAESLLSEWIADARLTDRRERALELFLQITPPLNRYQLELNAAAARLSEAIDTLTDDAQRAAREQELARLQPIVGRATYFAGWANYFLGVARQTEATEAFAAARDTFRIALGLHGEQYAELEPEWLGLQSAWRSRALIGLGLAEAALDNLAGSRACFQLLEHVSVPLELQDQAGYWFVQGLLNAGKLAEARDEAAPRIAKLSGTATRGKISLCVSLVRGGLNAGTSAPLAQELQRLGLEGLARLRQQKIIEQLMAAYDLQFTDSASFFVRWIQGRQLLGRAEQSKQVEDFRAAASVLAAALQTPDANQQVGLAAQCRHELAWCYFQAGEYESAARQYEQSVMGLKAADANTAAQSTWMAFVCYQKLIAAQPRMVAPAIEMLQALKRDFPDHPQAKRADYYIQKIRQSSKQSPQETVRELERVPADSPSYLAARYDICILWHQLWTAASEAERPALAAKLRTATQRYLSAASRDSDHARKVKCRLLAAEMALVGKPPDIAAASEELTQVESLISLLPAASSLAAEYHFRRLQLAEKLNDDAARRRHAEWLVANAAGSAYEIPALIVVAKTLDGRVENATDAQRRALNEEAYQVYRRLADRLGAEPTVLASQKNARVATSKAAQFAMACERFEEANELLERLLAALPNEADYLRRAGLAAFQAREYERALPHWRTLLAGLADGSEAWYEAKYHQLACLLHTDATAAEKVYRQFELLHPDLGPPAWREKFRQLRPAVRS